MKLNSLLLRLKMELKYRFSKKIHLINKKNPTAYVFLAADYTNLGDVAITESQKSFLYYVFENEYDVELVFFSEKMGKIKSIIQNLDENDIVTIIGGGNFGDRYQYIEYLRQLIVKKICNNKIFLFPQTFDFSDTERGRKELHVAKKIYRGNIVMCAREKASLDLMKENFKDIEVLLIPDIVLSEQIDFNNSQINKREKKIGLCLRNDTEKKLNFNVKKIIFSQFSDIKLVEFDTHVPDKNQSYEELVDELNNILQDFSTYKLVVTDRLHGMIFCFLTKTPCLFFDNSNKKVSGVFEWIKDTNFIKQTSKELLTDDIENFLKLEEVIKSEQLTHFKPLIDLLKES